MEKALLLAKEGLEAGEVPVGCVIVKNGSVICKGRNKTNEKNNATAHAEIEAISDIYHEKKASAADLLKGSILYVTVEPCIMCISAVMQAGVGHVVFGCYNEHFGGCGSVVSLAPEDYAELMYTEEAVVLLQKFYARENQVAPQPRKK